MQSLPATPNDVRRSLVVRDGVVPFASALGRSFSGPFWRQVAKALPILVLLSVFYAFMASAGKFEDLKRQRGYDIMSQGFQLGHLYIKQKPPPALLSHPNPFDPVNKPLWFWDATLYNGHLYLYWGPVPALLLWLFRAVTDYREPITDQWLTMIFMLGRLYAGAAIIIGLGCFVRTRQPTWLIQCAILVFGLTSPIPFIIARPYVYEACLAAGQCFLFCGLAAAFWGLQKARWRLLAFGLAGAFWGLAIGSRVTMSIPIPFLILATAGLVWLRLDRSLRSLVLNSLVLGVPVAMALGAYALYNRARFDSFTEFGVSYQLTTQRFITSRAFIIPNIFSYLFAPVDWSCHFPFVTGLRNRPLSSLITWPPGYKIFELVGGIMVTSGWCWLVLIEVWRGLAAAWLVLRGRSFASVSVVSTPEIWAALCSVAILASMWPVLGLWEASMRYSGDAIGGWLLLTVLAAFWLLRRADASRLRWPGIATRVTLIALGLHSCFVGGFSGIASYGDPFKKHNPALYAKLERALSVCPARPAH